MSTEQAKREQAFYNMMYKTHDEIMEELKEDRQEALDWLDRTDSWEEVSDKYWEVNGDTLSKEFYIENLDPDELADFILTYFDDRF